jgi:hypothetical protein
MKKKRKAQLITIPGYAAQSFGKPQKDVVEALSAALTKAKRGEIIGLSLAYVEGNNSTIQATWAAGSANRNLMMASVHLLHTTITDVWYRDTK